MNNLNVEILSDRCFMEKEFNQISEKQIIDFLPCILQKDLNDLEVLSRWESFFQIKKVPYKLVLTKKFLYSNYQNIFILYKQGKN